jgi:phosphoserine phosphatase
MSAAMGAKVTMDAPIGAAALIERLESSMLSVGSATGAREGASGAGASPPRFLLAFDGDGTLWDGDIGVEVFEALASARGIREAARSALAEEARRFGVAIDPGGAGDPHAIAAALHEAFLGGRYPDREAYAMHAWVFAGWTEREVLAFAEDVLREGRMAERLRGAMRPVLAWATERGVDAYVVSASPRAAVIAAAAGLGFPPERVLAMTPASEGGVLLPSVAGPITYGEGKLEAISEARPDAVLLGAFGDSAWDAAMLRASRVPVAVRPGPGLIEIAASIPGLVTLEV